MSVLRPSRRAFLAASAASLACAANKKAIPVGLELFSVRTELKQDLMATVRAVAKMGYDGVEFFSPYFDWTPQYAKDVRKLLDDTGIRCFSTHNGPKSFTAEGLPRAIELNQTIGSKLIIMASAGRVQGLDGWKTVAGTLSHAAEELKASGLRTGYHNHQLEFTPLDGQLPIEVLAANTPKDVVLQLDVGTCVQMKADPVAWIVKNPGRIRSLHAKDWSPELGYQVLFGEGVVPWQKVIDAASKTGGLEYILIEQEGSRFPELETAEKCLSAYRKIVKS